MVTFAGPIIQRLELLDLLDLFLLLLNRGEARSMAFCQSKSLSLSFTPESSSSFFL